MSYSGFLFLKIEAGHLLQYLERTSFHFLSLFLSLPFTTPFLSSFHFPFTNCKRTNIIGEQEVGRIRSDGSNGSGVLRSRVVSGETHSSYGPTR